MSKIHFRIGIAGRDKRNPMVVDCSIFSKEDLETLGMMVLDPVAEEFVTIFDTEPNWTIDKDSSYDFNSNRTFLLVLKRRDSEELNEIRNILLRACMDNKAYFAKNSHIFSDIVETIDSLLKDMKGL